MILFYPLVFADFVANPNNQENQEKLLELLYLQKVIIVSAVDLFESYSRLLCIILYLHSLFLNNGVGDMMLLD